MAEGGDRIGEELDPADQVIVRISVSNAVAADHPQAERAVAEYRATDAAEAVELERRALQFAFFLVELTRGGNEVEIDDGIEP